MKRFAYTTCCVNSTAAKIHAMVDAARDVTLATLRRHCRDIHQWAHDMSYAVGAERGLHLADDFAVSFHKSHYDGRPCYYISHSAIEYIWTES